MNNRCIVHFSLAVVALAGVSASAEAQYLPYYGKNRVKYDRFDWQIYRSPHFEVYYYPEFEAELGRVVSYAESAYKRVSEELEHEISFAIPLILYKTFSEFAQTNLTAYELPEGVLAFAEPQPSHVVARIDLPPDELYRTIIHELTHIFAFDIIPRRLIGGSIPLWVDEGLAFYMESEKWDSINLMVVRDAAVTDRIPAFSELHTELSRDPYNFGRTVFEFMEERFGEEGVRQFLFSLRRAAAGGVSSDVYKEAFRMGPDEFQRQYQKWLKERFKPFRDKEVPTEYSRDLAPDPGEGKWIYAFSAAPSPTGEMVALLSGNQREGEFDVVSYRRKTDPF